MCSSPCWIPWPNSDLETCLLCPRHRSHWVGLLVLYHTSPDVNSALWGPMGCIVPACPGGSVMLVRVLLEAIPSLSGRAGMVRCQQEQTSLSEFSAAPFSAAFLRAGSNLRRHRLCGCPTGTCSAPAFPRWLRGGVTAARVPSALLRSGPARWSSGLMHRPAVPGLCPQPPGAARRGAAFAPQQLRGGPAVLRTPERSQVEPWGRRGGCGQRRAGRMEPAWVLPGSAPRRHLPAPRPGACAAPAAGIGACGRLRTVVARLMPCPDPARAGGDL